MASPSIVYHPMDWINYDVCIEIRLHAFTADVNQNGVKIWADKLLKSCSSDIDSQTSKNLKLYHGAVLTSIVSNI